uniref:APC membrane recruitment protein 1 n=1 Tax=Monodelphis domestica TaxID=13616 RepID=F6WT87_MONDO
METYRDAHSEELLKTKGKAAVGEPQGKGAESRAPGQVSELEGPNSEMPPAGPGKFKKTALKLFGGKRSICTLPSFLGGGRSKGPGKGAAKRGLSKSKTHDGLQEASQESEPVPLSVKGANHNSPLAGSLHLLPSSLSSHGTLEAGTCLKKSPPGGPEKPRPERVPTAPRPKKGLKGLFNSIRRHRKPKVPEPERSSPGKEGLEVPKEGPGEPLSLAPQPISRDECLPLLPSNAKSIELQGPEPDPPLPVVGEMSQENPEQFSDASISVPPPLEPNPEPGGPGDSSGPEGRGDEEEGEPSLGLSGDQLSLLFGDVTSLKSFDSLTGCGDIIAEQDVDSITESIISAERGPGRESVKRSSCLVTYQGGGEEMAMQEEMEEEEDEEEETMGHLSERANSAREEAPIYHLTRELGPHSCFLFEGAHSYSDPEPGELLTPQSDQQESAPNSDEGYYDSNTPGPDDDSGDGLGPGKKDQLPRDSYSGDALYEFFEPCDSLTGSPPGDEGLFDPPGPGPELFDNFLSFKPFPSSKGPDPSLGTMETEEERLVTIQRQLLYWELRRKRQEPQGPYPQREKPSEEHHERALGPFRKNTGGDPAALLPPGRNLNSVFSVAPVWKDFSSEEECYEWKGQGTCPLQLCPGDRVFEPGPEEAGFEEGSPGRTYGSYSPAESPEADSEDREEDPAVSFSQALVEFTSNGTLFSSLSGSSDSDSSFAQNLPVLPPMVTFDIADVEREGEGECEGPPEFHTDDEDFDVGYIPKETLDDLDERLFPGSFRGLPWGVGSLPRHLGLPGLSPPPLPPPMTLNRRSRSLDTETLELELAGSQLAPSYMESGKREEPEEGRWGWESPLDSYVEPPETYDWPVWARCSPPTGLSHGWQQPDVARTPFGSPACYGSLRGLAPRDSWDRGTQVRHQPVRPSHLDLQGGPCWNPQAQYAQAETKKQAFMMSLESKRPIKSLSPKLPVKCKSVGIIRGAPRSPQSWEEQPKWHHVHSRGTNTNMLKGRDNHGLSFPPSYPSSAMNVSTGK